MTTLLPLSLSLSSAFVFCSSLLPQSLAMADESETPTINLKVVTQDGHRLAFKMKRNTKLIKLLLIFCERKQVNYRSMRFLYDGKRIKGKHTPNLLSMEDGDEIDAMTDQDGGAINGC